MRFGDRDRGSGVVSGLLRWFVDFHAEMDRGFAVMRGEEPVAGPVPGVDRSKKRGGSSALGRRCRGVRSLR